MKKIEIEFIKNEAIKRGGKLLSGEYNGKEHKLSWECEYKHIWTASWASVQIGNWCPTCGHKRTADARRHKIEFVRSIAKQYGGELLSEIYNNQYEKLTWKCSENHIFEKPLVYILSRKTWCKICSKIESTGEKICRAYLTYFFDENFDSCSESWLNGLRLDGFNKKLKLAFEYNGNQHYKLNPMFHDNIVDLEYQIERDNKKRYICKLHKINLIEIPYTIEFDKIGNFIKEKCINIGYIINKNIIDFKTIVNFKNNNIDKLQKIATSRGGKCISSVYINNSIALDWECEKLHVWKASAASIRRGSWCKICSNTNKKSIEDMKILAKKRNGECLSEIYESRKLKLKWKCKYNHIWMTSYSSIRQNTWCPVCFRNSTKLTIQDARNIAKSKNGECLSEKYNNIMEKLKWKCKNNHTWEMNLKSIKVNEYWCPYCSGHKLAFKDIIEIARERNGKCLSVEQNFNARTKLLWECSKKHQWYARSHSIKSGSWCQTCNRGGFKKNSIYRNR